MKYRIRAIVRHYHQNAAAAGTADQTLEDKVGQVCQSHIPTALLVVHFHDD